METNISDLFYHAVVLFEPFAIGLLALILVIVGAWASLFWKFICIRRARREIELRARVPGTVRPGELSTHND